MFQMSALQEVLAADPGWGQLPPFCYTYVLGYYYVLQRSEEVRLLLSMEPAGLGEIWEGFGEKVNSSWNKVGHFSKNLLWVAYWQKLEQPVVITIINQVDLA